eukprot:10422771-Ditylum_brightwellii.AAC.1
MALGNLDTNPWTKTDCFAPVLSQPELRLLLSLAAKLKVILQTADVSQAFCQSFLPPYKKYILRPPQGCFLTPPNHYFLLKKMLYGLKWSPRQWYKLAQKTLISLSLTQNKKSPCIFHGKPIPGKPPIYVGLYVDDIVFFSESDQ